MRALFTNGHVLHYSLKNFTNKKCTFFSGTYNILIKSLIS